MRSDVDSGGTKSVAGNDKYRAALVRRLDGSLAHGESIIAIMPFVSSLKRPKVPGAPRGKKGKIRTGVYQSWRRYRPMVLTDRRLFVFDSGRTPNPRELLEAFPVSDLELISLMQEGHGSARFVLELPGTGRVPFEAGRRDLADLSVLIEILGGTPS